MVFILDIIIVVLGCIIYIASGGILFKRKFGSNAFLISITAIVAIISFVFLFRDIKEYLPREVFSLGSNMAIDPESANSTVIDDRPKEAPEIVKIYSNLEEMPDLSYARELPTGNTNTMGDEKINVELFELRADISNSN